jgi:hypothetical protein
VESEKIGIADICSELEKLANANVFTEHTASACRQAASLLSRFREVIPSGLAETGWHNPEPAFTREIVEKLKWILVEQGEG